MKIGLALVLFFPRVCGDEPSAVDVPLFMSLPFAVLLLAMAAAPFIGRDWWKKNYPYVAFGLAFIPARITFSPLAMEQG